MKVKIKTKEKHITDIKDKFESIDPEAGKPSENNVKNASIKESEGTLNNKLKNS